MSQGAVRKSAAERKAEHKAKLQRQILDWIEVKRPEAGNILVVRVPSEKFARNPDEATPEQHEIMSEIMVVLKNLMEGLAHMGTRMAGGAVLSEDMNIEDVKPPPAPGQEQRRESGLVLPPGTRI